jgi:hypothetical protein
MRAESWQIYKPASIISVARVRGTLFWSARLEDTRSDVGRTQDEAWATFVCSVVRPITRSGHSA